MKNIPMIQLSDRTLHPMESL